MKKLVFSAVQIFSAQRIFWNRTRKDAIYLTFDDGPLPGKTEVILDLLDKAKAKATFFVIGERAEKHPDLMKKIAGAGHSIGNHTYSHYRFGGDIAAFLRELEKGEQIIRETSGKSQKLIRIPYGIVHFGLFAALLKHGYRVAFWNKDTKDYKLESPNDLSRYMNPEELQNGDVVLMHDFPEVTPEILDSILNRYENNSFKAL